TSTTTPNFVAVDGRRLHPARTPANGPVLHWLLLALCWIAFNASAPAAPVPAPRTNLIAAVLAEDEADQIDRVKKLIDSSDPLVEQALTAWRGGALYLLETNGTKIPFLLDAATDADAK